MKVIDEAEWRKRLGQPAMPKISISYEGLSAQDQAELGLGTPTSQLYYEIDLKAKLYLQAEESAAAEKFAEVFKSVWEKIADNDRARMVNCWNAKNIVPVIAIEQGSPLIAGYEGVSRTFQFHTEGVKLALADGMADLVVSHELGHAFCDTMPDSFMQMTPTEKNRKEVSEGRENEANLKAMDWVLIWLDSQTGAIQSVRRSQPSRATLRTKTRLRQFPITKQ